MRVHSHNHCCTCYLYDSVDITQPTTIEHTAGAWAGLADKRTNCPGSNWTGWVAYSRG